MAAFRVHALDHLKGYLYIPLTPASLHTNFNRGTPRGLGIGSSSGRLGWSRRKPCETSLESIQIHPYGVGPASVAVPLSPLAGPEAVILRILCILGLT